MTIAEEIRLDGGYTVEIHYDEDVANPLKGYGDGEPILVLHDRAEDHFGWTNDEKWSERLWEALGRAGLTWWKRTGKELDVREDHHVEFGTKYPSRKDYALEVIARWMRGFLGIRVVFPVGAGEHSGTWTYLGDREHWCDPGGWDSGWVGWFFATREQITARGFDGRSDEELADSLVASFSEFASWVEGARYGFVVKHEDGHEIEDDSSWGYIGNDCFDEGGHMRDCFMEVVGSDRRKRTSDEQEIREMALAETGGSA